MAVKPITPGEVVKVKAATLPDEVLTIWNEAIAVAWSGSSINGPVSLVEGSPCAFADKGAGSLVRAPDGYDTNNASIDWGFAQTPTPGAPNM